MKEIKQEIDVKAEKGAYFICSDLTLKPEIEKWMIIANVKPIYSGMLKSI